MPELTAQTVFDRAFQPGREPRCQAYKQGVMHCLKARIDGVGYRDKCPYGAGTAEAEAWHAGIAEGRELAPVGQAPAGFE